MNRKTRRIDFDMFVTKYIEYKPWRDKIYSACFPGGSNQILPPIGWQRAEELRDKYYYDEILFLVLLQLKRTPFHSWYRHMKYNAILIKKWIKLKWG